MVSNRVLLSIMIVFSLFYTLPIYTAEEAINQDIINPPDQKVKSYITALTIAGSDSSGGAGIQADLKTFSALGCYGMSVVTALTAQNTQGVQAVHLVPREFIAQQMISIFDDISVGAVKVGMLGQSELIEEVSSLLSDFIQSKGLHLVVDPVMYAKSGDKLLDDSAIDTLVTKLIPLATIITPNIKEASALLDGRKLETNGNIEKAAQDLLKLGPKAVVIKGGGVNFDKEFSSDCFVYKDHDDIVRLKWLKNKRVLTMNVHGTGCTFSAAITAFLSHKNTLTEAVRLANEYLFYAISQGAAYKLGQGHGPVHHFFCSWEEKIH